MSITVAGPTARGNSAQFVSQSAPTTMRHGTTASITVQMKNVGTTTWTSNPQDNLTWGVNRIQAPATVAPGQTATFVFNVTAPSTPGNYNFQWRMLQQTVEWFGDYTQNVTIAVQ